MPVDRTDELRAAAQALAQRAGRDPATLLTPPPPPERSDFARGAASVGAGIAALRAFAAARRRDYTEPGRASEAERDGIEAEVSAAIRDCRERIDALKDAAPAAAAAAAAAAASARRGRGGGRGGDGGGDMLAHHTGVVLILAERLTDVAERFDRQRAARMRSASQAATLRRRRAPLPPPPPQEPPPQVAHPPPGASPQQVAMLQESYALAQDLAQLVDGARAAEARMVEVSALSSTFAAHVAAQAQQIEALYATACETTRNFERGNAELELTIRRTASSNRTTAILLFGASFLLLLLDWLSG